MTGRRRFLFKKQEMPYTKIKYIESTGTQYIDTKYICGKDVRIETEFEYLQIDSVFRCIYGKQTKTAAEDAITVSQAVNYTVQAYWRTNLTPFTLEKDRRYKMLQSQNALVLDGVDINCSVAPAVIFYNVYECGSGDTETATSGVDYVGWSSSITKSQLTMYLMARNNNGSAGNFFKGRIYGFKIYESNILAMDLIPVLDSSKVPCFYDKISNELLYNKGTGEFNYSL